MRTRCMISALTAFLSVLVCGAASAGDGKVTYRDIRADSTSFVTAAPVYASKNGTAIIAFGGGDDVLRIVYTATIEIEKQIDEEIVFLHASDDDDPALTEFKIYTRGIHTGSLTFGPKPLPEKVQKTLTHAVEEGLRRVNSQ